MVGVSGPEEHPVSRETMVAKQTGTRSPLWLFRLVSTIILRPEIVTEPVVIVHSYLAGARRHQTRYVPATV